MSYAGLGSTSTFGQTLKRDELLRRTSAGATRLMRQINRLPAPRRWPTLQRTLRLMSPTLPARVEAVAAHLRRTRRLSANKALHEALALSMADAMIESFVDLGHKVMSGEAGALGESPEQVIENMARGIACSRGLQTSISDAAGRETGRTGADASTVGFELARSFATCSTDTPEAAPLPEPARDTDQSNLIIPIVVGVGVVAALGGIIYFTRKKT